MIHESKVDNTFVETLKVATKSVRKNLSLASISSHSNESEYESTNSESIATQPLGVPVATQKSEPLLQLHLFKPL